MKWRDLWPYARTWWGLTVAAATVLVAVYQAPRLMFETWDYYWDRFRDNAIYFLLKRRKLIPEVRGAYSNFGTSQSRMIELAYTIPEIAQVIGRKEKSVSKSLKRLARRGRAEQFKDGWHYKE